MTTKNKSTLQQFRTQRRNTNKHTQKGLQALSQSIMQDGFIGAITVAADGEAFDGSARLETVTKVLPNDPIIVDADGTRPIIVRRTDIATTDDPKAKRLAVGANVIARLDFDPDTEVLRELSKEDDGIKQLAEQDYILRGLMQADQTPDDVMAHWQGMPEFKQDDKKPFRSIVIHFETKEDVDTFARAVGQTFTDKTKWAWFPYRARENLKALSYES